MSEVGELINSVFKMKSNKSFLLPSVANVDLLLEGLHELENMIEMKQVKSSIVTQIKFLLINFINDSDKKFEGHMLHTVLSGPPGTGKTQIAIILSKIWSGLGLLKTNTEKKPEKSPELKPQDENTEKIIKLERQYNNLSNSGKVKNGVIRKLQTHILEMKNNMKEIGQSLNLINYRLKTLKREIDKKHSPSYLVDEIVASNEIFREKINSIANSNIPDEEATMPELSSDIIALLELSRKLGEQIESKREETEPAKNDDLIRIVSREDFVGGYLGQTAIKTEKLLRDSMGKVLFIDEAYSLINDEKDSFGREALTVLNRFMSEHSDSIIIIFAGYKDLMNQTIFHAQPGLKRRCSWYFEIKAYTQEGLSKIFEKQMNEYKWEFSPDVDLVSIFKENKKLFPNYGGSCLQLAFYCKLAYSREVFDKEYPNEKVINMEILNMALNYLRDNSILGEEFFPYHMYS